ncbi:MAG: Hsp20/alpha crystallin family protein [Dechloromonas sp.]|uniref:Hsp20/alpha crystallin family protein n=1 Tax=Dechloromonas sp. TaxID=1917218 RepID=UPI0027F565D2|nr:Hsp20/alpha crystallin family protein [Dechloromonas sp.]MBT9521774.1 Hsp20/alpha crystallin family protein [Dechloromonas sp.]
MNLVKWNPFNELEDISNSLNKFFGRQITPPGSDVGMLAQADWVPTVDISETDDRYLIKAEIPGVKKEDVKVTVQDGMLAIRGERKQEKEEKGKRFHRIERTYGSFMRSFQLPDDADETGVAAEFKDGMLNVTLKKSAKAKPKSIDIAVS